MFSLVNEKLKELFLSFYLSEYFVMSVFYCQRGSKTADICTRFFVDVGDQRKKLNDIFSICYFDFKSFGSDILCPLGEVRAK